MEDRLARVLREYGRPVLTDPVALRAALRATGPDDEDAAALVAMADASELHQLAVVSLHQPWPSGHDTAERITAVSGLDPNRCRQALRVLTAALFSPQADPGPAPAPIGPATGPPLLPAPSTPVDRITWDEPPAGVTPRRTRPLEPPRRRPRWLLPLVVVGAVAAVVVVVALVLALVPGVRPGGGPPATSDRYAVDQVAQRYRALGATLLDGALRCAQLPVSPGEQERVECDFGTFPLVLVTYDAPTRLAGAYAAAASGPESVRSGRRDRDGAAVAVDEQRSGVSSFYWHVESPRPVSASVIAPGVSLPELAEFFDGRGFAVLPRPEVPGPEFRSAILWELAAPHVFEDTTCVRVIPEVGEETAVQCTYADGSTATFAQMAERSAFTDSRTDFASQDDDSYIVPGSLEVRAWSRYDGPPVGQLVQYVIAEDGRPVLYFDDDAGLCFGVLFGVPGSTQAALLDRFNG